MHLGFSDRLSPAQRVTLVFGLVVAMIAGGVGLAPRFNRAEAAGVNLAVSISDASVVEGDPGVGNPTFAVFTVTLSGLVLSDTTVNYATVAQTATSPADYAAQSGALVFSQAGSKTISVPIVRDNDPEPNETFRVDLNGQGMTVTDGQGIGTIQNDDFALTVGDVSVTETDAGTTVAPMVIGISPTRNAPTTVKYATSNGTAVEPADYTATSGTATIPANTASVTVNVPVKGDTLYEDNETFNFTLTEPSAGVDLGDGEAVVTILDNEAPPADADKPVLAVKNASLKEGAQGTTSTLNFEVTLTPASTHTVTVKASTSDATAKAPGDYIAKTDFTLTFAPGQTSQNFPVTLVGDNLYEGDEDFTVTLSAPSAGAKLAATPTAKGTIIEDEDRPTLTVANAQATEGGDVEFTITLSAPIGHDVQLRYGTVDVTAKEPGDYTKVLESTGVTLPAGQTTKKVTVTTKQDTLDEDDEIFDLVVQMIDGTFVTNPPVTADGKIVDDDASPSVSVDNVTKNEGNEGTTPFEFTVTLSAVSGRGVSVNYGTTGITAATPEDFTGTNGTLTFAPGETTKKFTVNVKGDTTSEDDETFKVALSNAIGATLGTSQGTGTIKNDDTPLVHADEITTGAGPGGGSHVKAFQTPGGATSASFISFEGTPGVRVARGDLDGDGHDEIIMANGPGAVAKLVVLSANGKSVVASVDEPYGGFGGGMFVAAGDVDGDGKDEVITTPGAGGGPHVRVWKLVGDPGSRTLQGSAGFYGTDGSFSGGLFVAAGDTTGDGKDEIIVGNGAGGPNSSTVTVWSYDFASNQATQPIAPFLAYPGFTGGVRVAAADFDNDGHSEIVTGAGPGGNPHVRVFASNGGGLGNGTYAYNEGFRGGVWVATGDVDGDGTPDIITGAGPGGGPHVRGFNPDLSPKSGVSFFAYDPAFNGGVFVASGRP